MGSMLPLIEAAQSNNSAVIILNPNFVDDNKAVRISIMTLLGGAK